MDKNKLRHIRRLKEELSAEFIENYDREWNEMLKLFHPDKEEGEGKTNETDL